MYYRSSIGMAFLSVDYYPFLTRQIYHVQRSNQKAHKQEAVIHFLHEIATYVLCPGMFTNDWITNPHELY